MMPIAPFEAFSVESSSYWFESLAQRLGEQVPWLEEICIFAQFPIYYSAVKVAEGKYHFARCQADFENRQFIFPLGLN